MLFNRRFSFFAQRMLFACISVFAYTSCQTSSQDINTSKVKTIVSQLASDEMMGRKAGTANAQKAAAYISSQFKEIGLEYFGESNSYLQEFTLSKVKSLNIQTELNGESLSQEHVFFYGNRSEISIKNRDQINVIPIGEEANFFDYVVNYKKIKEHTLYLVDKSRDIEFQRAKKAMDKEQLHSASAVNETLIAWVLTDLKEVTTLDISSKSAISETKLANVVGVLPGKSKKEEYIVYSGHYDHLGIIKGNSQDSIANGADDDASGITAVITLAEHFKQAAINERSLLFVCFTAEEMGLLGSNYFTTQVNAEQIVAGINIEMIGKVSKFGEKQAFLTGFERSNLGELLNQSLEGTAYKIQPDPYTKYRLFYRSDNASLAKQGVPAHTISTSQIDSDPYYHKVGDEVKTLDINNLSETIKLIAKSTEELVKGKTSPSRIEKVD